jgi:hypothetical protein
MARDPISNEKCPGLPYGNEIELYSSDYRFGCGDLRCGPRRSTSNRVNGFLKGLIEAIANAKLRRMQRDLELRGIRPDRSDEVWIASSLRDGNYIA